nr:hypothetical protein [Nitrosopumilus sp.]
MSSNSLSLKEIRLSYNIFLDGLIILFVNLIVLNVFSNFEINYIVEASLLIKPYVLVNTTLISNCSSLPDNNISSLEKNDEHIIKVILEKRGNSIDNGKRCPFFKILAVDPCPMFLKNGSDIFCNVKDIDKKNKLGINNFDSTGLLIADTRFNQSYSYKMADPANPQKDIRIILDFQKHIQTQNHDINSPRLKIVRENPDGSADMSSAKNQEIIWTGNINKFFEEPKGNYQSETYIVLQFNTGRHGSNESDEERGFGVL